MGFSNGYSDNCVVYSLVRIAVDWQELYWNWTRMVNVSYSKCWWTGSWCSHHTASAMGTTLRASVVGRRMKKGWGQAIGCGQWFEFPSVLWHWWLDDGKGIWPVTTCASCPQRLLPEQLEEELFQKKTYDNRLTQVHLENVDGKVHWINECHSAVLLVVKDYTQLKELWRCICCVAGHYLDQKRLKQGLYRHPWDDISYVMPEKFNQWFRVKNNFVVIHQGFKNMFHHCLMVFLGRSLPIITACFFLFQNDVCSVFTLLP